MQRSSTNYASIAANYDQRYQHNSFAGTERELLDFIGNTRGLATLEVGCGTGHWLNLLATKAAIADARWCGLDASAEMLSKARARPIQAEWHHGSAQDLPWPNATFDRVYCINAVHHFPDPQAFLTQTARVLAPAGSVLIIGLDPHAARDNWCVYDYFPETLINDKRRYPAHAQLRAWLAELGFEDIESHVAEHLVAPFEAEQGLAEGRLHPTVTSQLADLEAATYAAGIARIQQDSASARANGAALMLQVDLRLYATRARKA